MKTPTTKNMKTFILVMLLLIFCPAGIFAQQVITFKSGYTCRAYVFEQTADTIRYQLVSDPNTTLSAPMWMVESITELGKLIQGKDITYWEKKVNKYTVMTTIGAIFLGGGAVLCGVAVHQVNESEFGTSEDVNGAGLFMGSIVFIAGGAAFTIVGGINLGKANHQLRKFKVEVGPNAAISGVTVRIKF